jgi:hypothetical protein
VPTPPGVVIQQRVPTPPGVPIAIQQPGSAPVQQVPHAVSWYPPQHAQFPSTHGNQGRFPAPYPQPPPVRPSHAEQTYELAATRDRDVLVRRIVWAIAIALGVILAIVVASRM